MSVIIYGPQGTGKGIHAEALKRHYGLKRVIDECDVDCPVDLYQRFETDAVRMKSLRALFITDEDPPAHLIRDRRIVHIARALVDAGIKERAA